MFIYKHAETIQYVEKQSSEILFTQTSQESMIFLRIKNAKVSGYFFYMNLNKLDI